MLLKTVLTTAVLSLASLSSAASSSSAKSSSTSSSAKAKSTGKDLPPIEIVGNKFYYSNNGSQFYIRGVAYQLDVSNSSKSSFSDPLADLKSCARDIPYLKQLNTNVVRVYAVNASLDHDDCMRELNDAGIYVIADLSEPTEAIDTMSPSWDVELYNRYTTVIDMFSDYTNVLGFFAGNEVITNVSTSDSAPFVKAAVRDMKQYIKDQGYRNIPVGYSANDDEKSRVKSADYFACGSEDVNADFYGINMYEWCGDSSLKVSGYLDRTEEFSNLTIPIFFSEYGCNRVQPRKFTEVQALYGPNMTDVWSGGIVYMYFQETNDYGLVTIDKKGNAKTLEDFNYLKSQMASINPTTHSVKVTSTSSASASGKKSSSSESAKKSSSSTLLCPATTKKQWSAATKLPPTPNEDFCDCAQKTFSCVVSDDVDEDDYADLFSTVCGFTGCADINGNGKNGTYGKYSFCQPKVKLDFILNKYWKENGETDFACNFDGSASINDSPTTVKSCSAILKGKKTKSKSKSHKSSSSEKSKSSSSAEDKEVLLKRATSDSASASASVSSFSSDSASASSSSAAASSSSSSSKSSASSLNSKRYGFSLSELSMTLFSAVSILVGVCVFAL